MNIGDRVRYMDGSEEGVVIQFLKNDQVEVEVEDGFRIPYLKRDLVIVAREEESAFGKEIKAQASAAEAAGIDPKQIAASRGLFLAFVPFNERLFSVYAVNNTDLTILFSLSEQEGQYARGIGSRTLNPRSGQKVHELSVEAFDRWPTLLVQALFFKSGPHAHREPLSRRLKFRAATFFKSKGRAPVLNKEAYVFQIDAESAAIDPAQVREAMMDAPPSPDKGPTEAPKPKKKATVKAPPKEVDLHIYEEEGKRPRMHNSHYLQQQVETFEKALDDAIASGMEEIVFIHGVGNGKLREEIQRQLSGHEQVEYFKDARREKFGYGATLVKLK